MTELKTHTGSCHCGKVRYEVDADLTGTLITCNCSICSRTGAIMAFVPTPQFRLKSGEESLTDYQFNHKKIHHLFCNTCGVRSFARGVAPGGDEMCMLNVRCIEGLELEALTLKQFDGRSL